MEINQLTELKALKDENSKLKRMFADQVLQLEMCWLDPIHDSISFTDPADIIYIQIINNHKAFHLDKSKIDGVIQPF